MNLLTKPSVIALVIANIIPLFGVFVWDWSVVNVLLLYWAESGVIGIYNILKMIKISPKYSVGFVPFFIVHFGVFMIAHLIFILSINSFIKGSEISIWKDFVNIFFTDQSFLIAILFLLVSHGVSHKVNFLGNREYQKTDIGRQMQSPYKRVMLMHVVLIFGFGLTALVGSGIIILLLFIFIKVILDIIAHSKEHKFI